MTEADWAGVTAVSTLVLASVALFGETIKRAVYRPRLELSLLEEAGDPTGVRNLRTGEVLYEARYFQAALKNTERAFPFHEATVLLLRVHTKRPDGRWRRLWKGGIPLQWQHEEPTMMPYRTKTVGTDRIVDLFNISADGKLHLNPVIRPNNLATTLSRETHGSPLSLAMDIQACSNEADSQVMRVEIDWDWTWREGAAETKDHLAVKMAALPATDAAEMSAAT